MSNALRHETGEDPRFSSGVPPEARARGLGFIELSGISRPAWLSADAPATAAPRAIVVSQEVPVVPGTSAAAQLLQGLIDELSGVAPQHPLPELTPTPQEQEPTAEADQVCETPAIAPLRTTRPVVALQALAEAEQLLQALDRDGSPQSSLPDEAVAMLQQALARDVPAESDLSGDVPQRALSALEAALPPLEDFATSTATPAPTPVFTPVSSGVPVAKPTSTVAREPEAEPRWISPPGYTVLGDGPVTWPGQPMRTASSRPGWAVALVLLVGALALLAWWTLHQAPASRMAAYQKVLGLWPQHAFSDVLNRATPEQFTPSSERISGTARAHALDGLTAMREGRFGDAQQLFVAALADSPSDPALRLVVLRGQARALAKLGEADEARAVLTQALQLPENLSRDLDYRLLAEIAREQAAATAEPTRRRTLLDEALRALRVALLIPSLSVEERRELQKTLNWLETEMGNSPAAEPSP